MQIGHGPPFVRESLFGGCGRVLVWNLLGRRAAPPFTAVLSCVLEENGRVGRHVQQEYDELVVGLTGYGEAKVNGKAQPFGPGAVVYLPLGSSLELINDAPDKELRYLIIKAEHRAGEDEAEAETEGEAEAEGEGGGENDGRAAVAGEIEIVGEVDGVS
jgi:mannose-6-phosphate isomerase-like protein (cupin superfamily)